MARSRTSVLDDYFLPRSLAIQSSWQGTAVEKLLAKVDRLERATARKLTSPRSAAALRLAAARLRLLLVSLTHQPLRDCLPYAQQVLRASSSNRFAALSSIAAFSVYCLEAGRPQEGLDLLLPAFEAVAWEGRRAKSLEARADFEALIARLQSNL